MFFLIKLNHFARCIGSNALAGAGGLAAIVVLAGCGPSPEDVCKKTFELAKSQVGEEAANRVIGGDLASCVTREETRKELQGLIKYRSNNACLMGAKDWNEAEVCSEK